MPFHIIGDNSGAAYTISVDTADVDVFTLAGSPATAVDVSLTINAGVTVYQSGGSAALRTGSFPAGSKDTLVNRGTICGAGGAGGAGGSSVSPGGHNGSTGGDAIRHEGQTLEIDNSAGYIYGGGGGAGGGGATSSGGGGGGGGGGRGRNDGPGGAGGSGGPAGADGTAGAYSGAGSGGAGGGSAGAGGDGGDFGSVGEAGSPNDFLISTGGNGGAPGYAVRVTAGSVSWLGGYSSDRVQGGAADPRVRDGTSPLNRGVLARIVAS